MAARVAFGGDRPQQKTGARKHGGNGQTATYNSVGTEMTEPDICNMHGTTLPLAVSRTPAEQFGHHRLEVAALCDAVTVPAVCACDVIVTAKMSAYSCRYSFLSDIEMC